MALFLPRRWRRQPPYPVRFRQDLRVSSGAVMSAVLAPDLVRNVTPVLYGDIVSPSLVTTPSGIGMVTSAAVQVYAPAYSAPWLTDVFTWVAYGSTPSGAGPFALLDTDDYITTTNYRHTQFRVDSGTLNGYRFNTAESIFNANASGVAANTPTVFAIRSSSTTFDVWVNKTKSSAGTITGTPAGAAQVPSRGITIGASQSGGTAPPNTDCVNGGATIYGWLGLNYWASDGLLTELANSFWSAFEPQRSVTYFLGTAGVNQSVDVPLATIVVAGHAPTANRTQSAIVPAAAISVNAHAPTINQTRAVDVPAANIVVAGHAPTVNRTQSVAVPTANIVVNAYAPTIGQGQSIAVPVANITVAAHAPTINRTQSVSVPVAEIIVNGYAPTVVNSGILPAAALAELYGGNIFTGKKKKKKKEDKPKLEEMVFAVAKTPDGKKAIIGALPKSIQDELPDPQLALVSDLVRKIEDASAKVQKEVERIYRKRRDDEDEDDVFILLM